MSSESLKFEKQDDKINNGESNPKGYKVKKALIVIMAFIVILMLVLGVFMERSCDNFINVAIDYHDVMVFFLSEVGLFLTLISCLWFIFTTASGTSSKKWITASIVWLVVVHILPHVLILIYQRTTSNPTIGEIIRAYDLSLRASEPEKNGIVPPWLRYIAEQNDCCGFIDENTQTLQEYSDSDKTYYLSIDRTLRRITCPSMAAAMQRNIEYPAPRGMGNQDSKFGYHPQEEDLQQFHIDYEINLQRSNSFGSESDSNESLELDESAQIERRAKDHSNITGCGSPIIEAYEECLARCFQDVMISFVSGFVPFTFCVMSIKDAAKKAEQDANTERERPVKRVKSVSFGSVESIESGELEDGDLSRSSTSLAVEESDSDLSDSSSNSEDNNLENQKSEVKETIT